VRAALRGAKVALPGAVALEALARRWGVPPWVLAEAPDADWLFLGLTLMELEADAHG
jgi:hypothetical protein